VAGLRLVFGNPAMRTPMLFGWLCAFYNVPEGVAAPLATAVGGGAVTVGLILAAPALGSAVGCLAFSRLVGPATRNRWAGPLAVATCACLIPFAARPGLGAGLLILALSGGFGCYQIAVAASFVLAAPAAHRGQAFGRRPARRRGTGNRRRRRNRGAVRPGAHAHYGQRVTGRTGQ
jgi:hypothetical protein